MCVNACSCQSVCVFSTYLHVRTYIHTEGRKSKVCVGDTIGVDGWVYVRTYVCMYITSELICVLYTVDEGQRGQNVLQSVVID